LIGCPGSFQTITARENKEKLSAVKTIQAAPVEESEKAAGVGELLKAALERIGLRAG
jgi:hypothetical protein